MGMTIEVVVDVGIGALCTVVYMGTSVAGAGTIGRAAISLASDFASTTLSFGVEEAANWLPMSLSEVWIRDSI